VAVRTTRITVETESLVVIRRAKAALAWCPECLANVETITLDAGSLAEPATAAQIREWLATGKLHLWQPVNGCARICVTSLLQCSELEEARRFSQSNENAQVQSRRKQK
jgi:hypothetical protein